MQSTRDLAKPIQYALANNIPDIQALRPSHVEIDVEALAANVRLVKASVGADVGIMAVVKANAYGHGAVTVARTALQNGASCLAVANLAEAIQLRRAGIDAPILVLKLCRGRLDPLCRRIWHYGIVV